MVSASAATTNQGLIDSLNQGAAATTQTGVAQNKTAGQLDSNDFMTLLVTQLKNQDPMNPQDSQQFSVDLAQFTQVEQLTKINDTLSKSSGGDAGSMASYLGRQVVLGTDTVSVAAGDGGLMKVSLPADASSVKINLLNSDGSIEETVDAGALKKGENTVKLQGLKALDGDLNFSVTALGSSGSEITSKGEAAAVVTGFIPGADPKLLLGSKQISPSDIVRVES